jgi:hypothetical protein
VGGDGRGGMEPYLCNRRGGALNKVILGIVPGGQQGSAGFRRIAAVSVKESALIWLCMPVLSPVTISFMSLLSRRRQAFLSVALSPIAC